MRPAGRLPAYATSQREAAIAEAVPKHNFQTRSGFIPACRRWRFFAEILLNLFVDKAVPELLLLDCAAEPAPRGRDVRRRHRGYNAGPSPGCIGQPQNWRFSLLLLLLLLVLVLVVVVLVLVVLLVVLLLRLHLLGHLPHRSQLAVSRLMCIQ